MWNISVPAQVEIERQKERKKKDKKNSNWRFQMQDLNNELVLSFHWQTKSSQVQNI